MPAAKKAAKAKAEPEAEPDVDEARRARLAAAGITVEYIDETGELTVRVRNE